MCMYIGKKNQLIKLLSNDFKIKGKIKYIKKKPTLNIFGMLPETQFFLIWPKCLVCSAAWTSTQI